MKIQSGIKALLPAWILAMAVSCGTSKDNALSKSKGIPLMPEIVGATISKKIVSYDQKDTIASTLTYEFYAAPQFPWQDSVNFKIGRFVWSTIEYNENPYVYKPLAHQYFYDRLDEFEKSYKAYEQEAAYAAIWNYEGENKIKNNLKGYVQLNQEAYMFTGGAHPNSIYLRSVISKEDGSTLLLKDLVNDLGKFNKIAEKYFLAEREMKAEELVSEDFWFENKQFACNDNFSISPEGITFFFNAYEIAPYAFGTTEFTVPMNKVKELLNVEFQFEK